MKKLSVIVSLLLVAILSFGMVGCSSYSSLKKAFEKEGYKEITVIENSDDKAKYEEIKKISDELGAEGHIVSAEKEILTVKYNVCAFILEFKATEDMKKAYEESETIKGLCKDVKDNDDVKAFVETLEKNGLAKGNCLVIPLSLIYFTEITDIVKNA